MSISELLQPNYYDLFSDTLTTRIITTDTIAATNITTTDITVSGMANVTDLNVSEGRQNTMFYGPEHMFTVTTVGAAPTVEMRTTGAGNALPALHIVPGVTCVVYINVPLPTQPPTRGYYISSFTPVYRTETASDGLMNGSLYVSVLANNAQEATLSTAIAGSPVVITNMGASTTIKSQLINLPAGQTYVAQNEVYTIGIDVVSGTSDIFIYGSFVASLYFYY